MLRVREGYTRDEPQAGQTMKNPSGKRGDRTTERPNLRLVPPLGPPESLAAAKAAGLRYTSDAQPGIRRIRSRGGFRFLDAKGRTIRNADELRRIRALVIPPAWTNVWICTDLRGHLQATGRDARGRKQYRYHPQWRAVRDETKYYRLTAFARALPGIRKRVSADLAESALTRRKVLAAVVCLLEKTLIRVGNDEYAKQNRSFGLTTLRDGHVTVSGSRIRFSFRGKSGVDHDVNFEDRRLARIVKACRDLPGYDLFQYLDDDGVRRTIGSADVNAYLKEISGEEFTSKDFRTWAGTVLAAEMLETIGRCTSDADAKKNIVRAVEAVAGRLGNTRAVCRKSYIHPAVLDGYAAGTMLAAAAQKLRRVRDAHALSAVESAVLKLLERAQRSDVRRRA